MKLNNLAYAYTSPSMMGRGTALILHGRGGGVSCLYNLATGREKVSKKPHHHAPFFARLLNYRRAVPLPEQVGEVRENVSGIRL